MVIVDMVFEDICSQIASHPPERGGALYGPRNYPAVTHFELDQAGTTSAVSYTPSTQLINNVPRVEAEMELQFKGIIHSHPSGFAHPSSADESAVTSFFRVNPHFSRIELPIVQHIKRKWFGSSDDFIFWFSAERQKELNCAASQTGVYIKKRNFFVLPLIEHAKQILKELGKLNFQLDIITDKLIPLKLENAEIFGILASSKNMEYEIYYYISIDYPIIPPIVMYRAEGKMHQLNVEWKGLDDKVDSYVKSIGTSLANIWKNTN